QTKKRQLQKQQLKKPLQQKLPRRQMIFSVS
ncbi:protein TolA, partial [Escherichia coli 8.2524]